MNKVMILMRGIPGSGKSTISQILGKGLDNSVILSTDDFFMINGEYKFDPSKLPENHQMNQTKALKACMDGKNIIIDNTNVENKFLVPYVDMATQYGYHIFNLAVLEKQDVAFKRQTHNVPYKNHQSMHNRLIDSIQEYKTTQTPLPDYIDPNNNSTK